MGILQKEFYFENRDKESVPNYLAGSAPSDSDLNYSINSLMVILYR